MAKRKAKRKAKRTRRRRAAPRRYPWGIYAIPASMIWRPAELKAWAPAEKIKPSEWATEHYVVTSGRRPGPYRHETAPYLKDLMDLAVTPGVNQMNFRKPVQIGGSTWLRVLIGYFSHVDPAPIGMTFPNEEKGKGNIRDEIHPLFRTVSVLAGLLGSSSKSLQATHVRLTNGFKMDLMWSGSPASMASNPYKRVVNDEVDKYEPWAGKESDPIKLTEMRLTTYEHHRLQLNISTPTTTDGYIHQLYEASSVQLEVQIPCPHCGRFQAMSWHQLHWASPKRLAAMLAAARDALEHKRKTYAVVGDGKSAPFQPAAPDAVGISDRWRFRSLSELRKHVAKLVKMAGEYAASTKETPIVEVVSRNADVAVWFSCIHCRQHFTEDEKSVVTRRGQWRAAGGGEIVDADGVVHEHIGTVERFPPETSVGVTMTSLGSLFVQWITLIREWLDAQKSPSALQSFTNNRLGEAFEFKLSRPKPSVFSSKCQRATMLPGRVPAWVGSLIMTVDTQIDHFYVVVRGWGARKSQRIWHGIVRSEDDLDELMLRPWPQDDPRLGPMFIDKMWIDSGGTSDELHAETRTQQIYNYAEPRNVKVVAIKGAAKPRSSGDLYWAMANPRAGDKEWPELAGLNVDTHRANDLLSVEILAGLDPDQDDGPLAVERWFLNTEDDASYNAHLSAVARTVDLKTKRGIWRPVPRSARHDYRDCEAYQMAAAMAYRFETRFVSDADVIAGKLAVQQITQSPTPDDERRSNHGDDWAVTPLE